MNNRRRLLALLAGTAGAGLWWKNQAPVTVDPANPSYLNTVLASVEGNDGFARAERPIQFQFPRDHGPHTDFRSEWWYFTGHLATPQARAFGFQLTLFRFELGRHLNASSSAWRRPRVLLGHFAITDIDGQHFHAFERMSRDVPWIAGVGHSPPAVWLDDWRIDWSTANGHEQFTLQAAQDGIELKLKLIPAGPTIAQGDAGLSRKSAAPGNASYYYSIPRLDASGDITLPDHAYPVTGSAWLDREWSTSALARNQSGWDWFALQLDDGGCLMYYRLRQSDGATSRFSAGSYVSAQGHIERLDAKALRIEESAYWRSGRSGRRYPAAWRLSLSNLGFVFELKPRLATQEWSGRFPYWEGAVNVTSAGAPAGLGYVELTGY